MFQMQQLHKVLVAPDCYKCSPVQNCSCPKYICTCCIYKYFIADSCEDRTISLPDM